MGADISIMLPTTEGTTIAPEFVHTPYWGTGVSNQLSRNSPLMPLGPGVQGTNASLYVPKLTGDFEDLQEQINEIVDDIGDIALSTAPVGNTPNAAGATVNGLQITLQPANTSNPGVVTTGGQSFAGAKSFQSGVTTSTLTNNGATYLYGPVTMSAITTSPGGTLQNVVVDTATGKIGSIAGGVTSLGPVGNSPNANAAILSGGVLSLQVADANFPGVITTGPQTIVGAKFFQTSVTTNSLSSNGSTYLYGDVYCNGINSPPGGTPQMMVVDPVSHKVGSISGVGISSVASVGATPNTAGASISGSVLTLQPADANYPGTLTAITQTIGGPKTFNGSVETLIRVTTPSVDLPAYTSTSVGTICQPAGNPVFKTSSSSVAVGSGALPVISAANNTAMGAGALTAGTLTGTGNTVYGGNAGKLVTSGLNNVLIGYNSAGFLTTGSQNVVMGTLAGAMTTGSNNVCIGHASGTGITTGSNNVLIGLFSGNALNTQNGAIVITTDNSLPQPVDNSINIGTTTTAYCQIRGIAGVTPTAGTQMVIIDPTTHRLGSQPVVSINSGTFNTTLSLPSVSAVGLTIRGASTTVMPITLTRVGNTVSMTIANFNIVSLSSGTGVSVIGFNLTMAANFRPTYDIKFPAIIRSANANIVGMVNVSNTGQFNLTTVTGPNIDAPMGAPTDITVTWQVV